MREIKFRVPVFSHTTGNFVKYENWRASHMRFSADASNVESNDYIYGDDQQFTGLRDKNGVEIYEGDILLSHITKYRYVVTFDIDRGWFMANRPRSYFATYNWEQGEVIGNIHENPELLTKD